MGWFKKYWFWVLAGAVFVWWFFTGDTPVNIIANLIGRGLRLGLFHQDASGNNIEQLDDQLAGAVAIVGRPIARDAFILAMVSASEHAAAGEKEKALMQRIVMNYADSRGESIEQAVTGGKGFGHQAGRYCSTVNGPWEDDLKYAEANLAGTQPDDSMGAKHWVHKTGFATFTDYQATCDSWYASGGIVPINVGGVSSLRIFIPESLAQQLGLEVA